MSFHFQNIDEEEENQQHDEVSIVEEAQEIQNDEDFEMIPQTNEDNGSSNYGFDDNLTYEQQSNEKEETNQADEQDTFMPDLADIENANSFPSAIDDNSAQQCDDSNSNAQGFEDYQMIDDKTEDTFAQSDENKPDDADATSLDAENISEDELPGPAKPKVQDAEEVSDEELPGPKLAELPADTEVVSEEELPALKKEGKRKHEDYDPCDPTDEADEKKAKTDGEF